MTCATNVADRALSSDAGKGWVSPEAHGRLREWARKIRKEVDDHAMTGTEYAALLAEAEALGLK